MLIVNIKLIIIMLKLKFIIEPPRFDLIDDISNVKN